MYTLEWYPRDIDLEEMALASGVLMVEEGLGTPLFETDDGKPDDRAWLKFMNENSYKLQA